MSALTAQRLLARPFLVLGAWRLFFPHMVEALCLNPPYRHMSPVANVFMLGLCFIGWRASPCAA